MSMNESVSSRLDIKYIIREIILDKYLLVVILLILITTLSILSPHFLTTSNMVNIMRQITINFILASAATIVIISGGIDLSVGSVVALSGVVAGMTLNAGGNFVLAIMAALAAGTLCGAFNGILVSKTRMAPFIATLGMMSIARGLALALTGGRALMIDDGSYLFMGSGHLFELIPMPIVVAFIVLVACFIFLSKTWIGRYVYAIGGNEEVARLSGVRVDKILLIVYCLAGFLAGLAAVVLTGRLWSAPPIAAQGAELQAIAAAVIGGASLRGGIGKMSGTLYGAFVIGIIGNGLNLLGVSSFWQQVVIGFVIIFAVLIDQFRVMKKKV